MNYYKDHYIKPIVYNRPKGEYFEPRARIFQEHWERHPLLEWPNQKCGTRAEAEALTVELAKAAIDRGELA